MADHYTAEYLSLLRQQLNKHFSMEEIRALCFDMGLDAEEIAAVDSPKPILTLNLITYLVRRGQLDKLILACEQARSRVPWRSPRRDPDHPVELDALRIFLCHASQDKAVVRELYRKLLASGFEPWFDEEKLLGGQDWDLEIAKAIKESHVIIVCLSHESVSKVGFVQKEIRFTLDRALEQPEGAIFLIPLKLTQCEVPVRLQPFQWINYYEENGYEKLLHALRARADKKEIQS